MSTFPIHKAPADILRVIFHSLIDDEAATCRPKRPLNPRDIRKPKVAVGLALVCRYWRNLIYETSAFWTTIVLNMIEPEERVQEACNRLGARAKGAPVDLYIIHLHRPGDGWSHISSDCCDKCPCRNNTMSMSMTAIQNVRRLYINASNCEALRILPRSILPSLEPTVELIYEFRQDHHPLWQTQPTQLVDHSIMQQTSNLRRLCIGEIGAVQFSFANNQPLFPRLRILELANMLDETSTAFNIIQLLSHCPGLETLDYNIKQLLYTKQDDRMNLCSLKNLKTLICRGHYANLQFFTDHLVIIPSLTEFRCIQWQRAYNTGIRDFLNTVSTITHITLYLKGMHGYEISLIAALNLESLCLKVSSGGDGEFLKALVEPYTSEMELQCCCSQTLRLLTIECNVLGVEWFKKLARTRCIRPRGSGFTRSGCLPLELLELRLLNSTFSMTAMNLAQTPEWKAAEVVRSRNGWYDKFQLRWK